MTMTRTPKPSPAAERMAKADMLVTVTGSPWDRVHVGYSIGGMRQVLACSGRSVSGWPGSPPIEGRSVWCAHCIKKGRTL